MSDAARPPERLGFLDVARGLAALLVLLSHVFAHLAGAAALGRIGVLLFLVVSGFIIPASLEQGGSNVRFWLRRLFRLFPLYWLSVVVAYGCHRAGLPGIPMRTPGDWLLNLTMLQRFFYRPDAWGVFWTLQLELVIYAACSLLFAARLLGRAGWVAALAVATYAALGVGRPLLEGKVFALNGTRFLYFAPLVGLVAQRYWAGRLGAVRLAALVLGQALMVLAIWGANHALFPAEMTAECLRELARTWLPAYAGFFLLLAARRLPMPAPGRWLGRISYSIYLLHPSVFLVLVATGWPTWLIVPAGLAATLLLADLAYRAVEAPGIAAGRALERRWPGVAVPIFRLARFGRIAYTGGRRPATPPSRPEPGAVMSICSSARVHPTAVISPEAELADDVEVGPYAIIEGPVRLGPGCVIRPHAHLIGPLTMGRGNKVFTGAVLGERPQHLKYNDEPTGLEVGDDNTFREYCTIHRGTTHSWKTVIGSRNFFMGACHVAHDCRIGDGCILANCALLAGHCVVGDGAYLSGNCVVHQFVRVGRLALLSGVSGTSKDIPPFIIQQDINSVTGVNVVGMRRAGMSHAEIGAVRQAYQILFREGLTVSNALARLEAELAGVAAVAELIAFIRGSARGINTVRERGPSPLMAA